jgi:phage N-6-adenine-methyltransferase
MSLAHQIAPNGIAARALASAEPALARYDAACRAIAAAKSVDEVKELHNQSEAMRAYAKQAKNKQLEIDASEIRFRAERRIGELMAAQKGSAGLNAGGRPSEKTGSKTDPVYAAPTLAEAGIDKHLADRARKYAAVPEMEFESILADRRERIETENKRVTVNLIDAGHRVTLNTGENEWYTPENHILLARSVLGHIDLDPASSHVANRVVGADKFFSEETNGLAQEWAGRVWMNPPYAQPLIAHFAEKLVQEFNAGRVTAAIVLTNDSTDTAWFHQLAMASTAICFTRGRIKFVSPNGESGMPTQGQAFFYFGSDVDIFADVFADVGFIAAVRP